MRIESNPAPNQDLATSTGSADFRIYSKASRQREVEHTTVLVIDDDPLVIRLIEKSLEGSAVVLHEFGVPEAGVLDLEGIDLVFLDYKMPIRDGLEILGEIRSEHPDLPVVFLTGFGSPEVAEAALAAGATEFLTKPAGPSVIRSSFSQLIKPKADLRRGNERSVSQPVDELVGDRFVAPRPFQGWSKSGEVYAGRLVRFTSESAVVEFPKDADIEAGIEIKDISFTFGRQRVWSGAGVVADVTVVSPNLLEAEVVIPGMWNVVEDDGTGKPIGEVEILDAPSVVGRDLAGEIETEQSELPDEFRLAAYELAGILRAVQQECHRFEIAEDESIESVDQLRAQENVVQTLSDRYAPAFWRIMLKFERSAAEIKHPKKLKAAKSFAKKVIFPMALSSPFLSRVVEKPIGVPGDFGMLGQILGNPLEGNSLYDRIFNSWILNCGAADAYRYRVDLLSREIYRRVEECSKDGAGPTKILSMASGVAYEVQRYIESPTPGCRVDFSLVDFSTDTLDEASRQYGALGALPEGVSLSMHQSSVIDLANRSRGVSGGSNDDAYSPDTDYDLVYCAGLFDYLSDRLIVKVISYLFGILRPGGKLVVSNYTINNPIQSWMTMVMDWELIYRSEEQFSNLVEKAVGEASFELEVDRGKVEVYGIIRK